MKLKSLFLTLLVMLSSVVMAQVESGKVYRIVSSKYGTVITANPLSHKLTCVTKGDDSDYQQMWKFESDNDGKFYIMNVFSGRYIQSNTSTNVLYVTGTEKVGFFVRENVKLSGCYNIDINSNSGDNSGLHCDASSNVVPWSDGPNNGEVSGTEWVFEAVSIGEAEITEAQKEFASYNDVYSNKETIVELVNGLFEDKAGTVLKSDYASMDDDALIAVMEGVPAELQQAVLKVKNNSWATEERENLSEKNFRIYDYKPYSNPERWKDILYHRPFNRINNPTGICSVSDRGFVYIFVDEIPEGTEVYLAEMNGTAYFGTDTQLVEGLNVVPSACKDGVLYIRYICDTHTGFDIAAKSGPKKLSDYPTLKVHIEGGYVNGFWSKERGHTNEDWVYMGQKMFRNAAAVQAVGDHSMLNFRKFEFLMPYQYTDAWGFKVEGCPTDIETVMKFWDFWNERQRWYMNLDDYYDYFNNKQLAMSDDGGFMDAGNYRTHYNNNTLTTIVNIDRISRDGGSAWGPLHEIGHTNQYAFEIVGTSEVSNNALANFTIFDTGTHTSRGWNMDAQIKDFENKIPYVVRGEGDYGSELFSMTRMYFQLFLYFHAAEKCPEFYPALFEELRKDKLVGWVTSSNRDLIEDNNGFILGSMDATNDQLKFVEKCCSIAQMDLTEFFEAWGFFIPMKNAFVGDYGHHHVYLLQDSIDACKARIKAANYPKKGGHLMFLEDRIRHSKQKRSILNENPSGYRADYSNEAPVANNFCGLFGQWEDYIDETVMAQDYYYAISGAVVTVLEGENAKGALGFKLYDADTNELITYTNRLSMNIPVAYLGKNFKVVAAQANGEDYVLPHASEGSPEMQKDMFDAALADAKTYLGLKSDNGKDVGFFHPEALADLQIMRDSAVADSAELKYYSHAEWSVKLNNEITKLNNNPTARILFKEGMEVNIFQGSWNHMTHYDNGITIANNSADDVVASRWSLEYAGEQDVYYLKCANGKYIDDFVAGDIVTAKYTNNGNAARFTITYDYSGNLYFNKVGDGDALLLGAGQQKNGNNGVFVQPVKTGDRSAEMYAYVYKDNSAEFYKEAVEEAMKESRLIITEVLNIDSIKSMNIFNNTIIVNDRNLETYILDLYNHYATVAADIDNASMHEEYLNTFRALFRKINGTYTTIAPVATMGNVIAWYRLRDNAEGDYLSVKNSSDRNDARLNLVDEYSLDDRTLWAFAPTGRQNEFKIYNCARGGFISNKAGTVTTQLFVTEDCKPLTVAYDSNKNSIYLTDGSRYLSYSQSYIGLSTKTRASSWAFELVLLEENEDVADIITLIESILEEGDYNEDCYDLNGRKVVNPGKGIYIQNGKKVIFK